jgi:hypothetical protein
MYFIIVQVRIKNHLEKLTELLYCFNLTDFIIRKEKCTKLILPLETSLNIDVESLLGFKTEFSVHKRR